VSFSTLRVARFPVSILISALVLVGLLLFPGPAFGVQNSIDVNSGAALPDSDAGASRYLLGETIVFPPVQTQVQFSDLEDAVISRVQLVVSGPQGMTVTLPVEEGTYTTGQLPDPSQVYGDISVTVAYEDVTAFGYGYGGGFFGDFAGYGYKRSSSPDGVIKYGISWTPPVLLDPAPSFSLLTDGITDTKFAIPQLAAPSAISGTVLPATDAVFTIPQVGAPSFGTVLPSTIDAWTGGAIPSVTVTTNAAAALPALPNSTTSAPYGFNIPTLATASAPAGVSTFPDTSASFDIPGLSAASAPGGVPDAPNASVAYTVPSAQLGRALGTDNTNFWVVSDGAGSGGVDLLVKLDAAGAATGTSIDGPSDSIEGIAFLNDKLFVAESEFRCYDHIENACENSHRIYQIDPTDPPTNNAQWAASTEVSPRTAGKTINIFSLVDPWENIGGITAQGTGASGSLWITNQYGWRMYNVSQAGVELDSPNPDNYVESMDGIAYNSADNLLYTVDQSSGVVSSWTTDGGFVAEYSMVKNGTSTKVPNIRGMTFKTVSSAEVLFMASASSGEVYQTFFPATVSTSPRGLAYSSATSTPGEALWVLVDASPKDKLLKVNPSTGALITAFGTNGSVDAPSEETQGITFLGSSLYVIANDADNRKNLYQVNSQTGVAGNPVDLQNSANVWDDLGGITNNGTNLVVHTRSFNNSIYEIDTSGELAGQEQGWPCCPSFNGVRGFAYHSGRAEFFGVRGTDLGIYNGRFEYKEAVTLTQTVGPVSLDIRGMDFNGDVLYSAHLVGSTGKISASFLGTTVSTTPTGMAHTPATSTFGDALYILVDADPVDRLIKVDPTDGTLITDFSTDGAVDAPSNATAGMTFMDTGTSSTSFLWIVANEQRDWETETTLYKINPTTGAQVGAAVVVNDIWGAQGGIANDGTNLILFSQDNAEVTTVGTDGNMVGMGDRWLCCPMNAWGATGFGRHSGRDQYFAAKGNTLLTLSGDRNTIISEQTLSLDGTQLGYSADIQALAFDQDVVYIARVESSAGKISVGKLVAANSTDPRGLAFSPSGSTLQGTTIGEALWVLTDGSPLDVILKVNPDTGALITAFSTDGAIDAPSNSTEGMTYLDGYLWVISNAMHGERKLYKIKATDGSLSNTYNLQDVWDDIGGVTNDGTNIFLHSSDNDQWWSYDANGSMVEQGNRQGVSSGSGGHCGGPCGDPGEPANAAAYRADASQLVTGNDGALQQYVVDNDQYGFAGEFKPTGLGASYGIRGATFDSNTADDASDDVLYVAHATGKISKTAVPGEVSNIPRALAYDAAADELYILVAGKGSATAHVLVVDPDAGTTIKRHFPAESANAYSLTYMDTTNDSVNNGLLYMGYTTESREQRVVTVNATTGATIDTLNTNFWESPIGMANNQERLLVTQENNGSISQIRANDGNTVRDVFLFDVNDHSRQFWNENFPALAYLATDEEYFPVSTNNNVFRFDLDGRLLDEWALDGLGDVSGAVFAAGRLLLAVEGTNEVRATRIPLPVVNITNDPVGIATDGTSVFIAVDAVPSDKIMKVNSAGALVPGFGAGGSVDGPGAEIADMTYWHPSSAATTVDDALYVVTNDNRTFNDEMGSFSVRMPMVSEIDLSTGEEASRLIVLRQHPGPDGIEKEDVLFDRVGAIASDGDNLYLAVRGDDCGGGSMSSCMQRTWWGINPDNTLGYDPMFDASFVVGFDMTEAFNGTFGYMPGFSTFEYASGSEFSDGKRLLAAGSVGNPGDEAWGAADHIVRMGTHDGVMREQAHFVDTDIQGMALIGIDLLLADNASDTILATSLPERTVEQTIVGSYSGLLRAQVATDASTLVNVDSSTPAAFLIERSPDVRVRLSLNNNFVTTTQAQIVTGLVSDPSVTAVELSVALPSTALFNDPITASSLDKFARGANSAAIWHVVCDGDAGAAAPLFDSGPCAWRFGVPGSAGFDTGGQVVGGLIMNKAIDVAGDTELSFKTVYQTQPDPGNDKKMVQVAVVTTDAQGNNVVGDFKTLVGIIGDQFSTMDMMDAPAGAHPGFYFEFLNPFMTPGSVDDFHETRINLGSEFAGQRVKIKFLFDSVNEFSNGGAGWYVDDIQVRGAGTESLAVSTTALATPQTHDGTVYFRTFTSTVNLSEGSNVIGAKAVQTYSPFKSAADERQGNLDQTQPTVTLAGIAGVVNTSSQTLQINASDRTFQRVEVFQNDGSQPVFGSTTPGAHQAPVELTDGTNVFRAVATDLGGLTTTRNLTAKFDDTPPAVAVGYSPIISSNGVRSGDSFFILAAASDSGGAVDTGVVSVVATIPGGAQVELAPIGDVSSVVALKHGLSSFGTNTTTHVGMINVAENTPVGQMLVVVDAVDGAGIAGRGTVNANVLAALTDRSVYLGQGTNYVGFPLVLDPDELLALLNQQVTNVNPALATALGGTVKLSDVIESVYSHTGGVSGAFHVYLPGDGVDTLTSVSPFDGLIVNVRTSIEVGGTAIPVFTTGTVSGSTVRVPIKWNAAGVFQQSGAALPPSKDFSAGFNLWSPHATVDDLFERPGFLRAAVVDGDVAVSAITQINRIEAVLDNSEPGNIGIQVENRFQSSGPGDVLTLMRAYWTFMVADVTITP
jgi:hypothetical protein